VLAGCVRGPGGGNFLGASTFGARAIDEERRAKRENREWVTASEASTKEPNAAMVGVRGVDVSFHGIWLVGALADPFASSHIRLWPPPPTDTGEVRGSGVSVSSTTGRRRQLFSTEPHHGVAESPYGVIRGMSARIISVSVPCIHSYS